MRIRNDYKIVILEFVHSELGESQKYGSFIGNSLQRIILGQNPSRLVGKGEPSSKQLREKRRRKFALEERK